MILFGSRVSAGLEVARNTKNRNPTAGVSSAGLSVRKKKANPSVVHNIDKIKGKSNRALPEEFHYKPKVSETFLENWLDFPVDRRVSVIFNSLHLWLTWLKWTNRSMAGLDPKDTSIRSRVCSQLSVLGTAAGLFLVIAIAGFLVPPEMKDDSDRIYLNIFGLIMYTASVSLIFYIGITLTGIYPLIESLRDDVAFDAFENFQNRVGGADAYLFFIGMHLVLVALLVAAKILYSVESLILMFAITIPFILATVTISRKMFLALDPISSMHLGLSNDPEEQYRAELLSHFILRKIPNNIMTDDLGEDVFVRKNESVKYEETKVRRASMQQEMEIAAIAASKAVGGDGEVQLFNNQDIGEARVSVQSKPGGLNITDMESSIIPFNDKQYEQTNFSEHTSLKDAFSHPENYLFRQVELSLSDSVAAYDCLTRAGCLSWKELISFLDDHKQPYPCNCSVISTASTVATASSNAQVPVPMPAHREGCAVRQVGAWTDGLMKLGVPAFHARKILLVLKSQLR